MSDRAGETDFELAPHVEVLPPGDGRRPATPESSQAPATASPGRRTLGDEHASLLSGFAQAVRRRTDAERAMAEEFGPHVDPRTAELQQQLQAVRTRRDETLRRIDEEQTRERDECDAGFASRMAAAQAEHESTVRQIERRHNAELAELESRYRDSEWVMSSVMDDTAEDSPKRQFDRFQSGQDATREQQAALWTSLESAYSDAAVGRRWAEIEPAPPVEPPRSAEDAQSQFAQRVEQAQTELSALRKLKIPRVFSGYLPVVLFGLLGAAASAAVYFLVTPALVGFTAGRTDPAWLGISVGSGFGTVLLIVAVVYAIGRSQQSEAIRGAQGSLSEAAWLRDAWERLAAKEFQRQRAEFASRQKEFERRRREALQRYEQAHTTQRDEIEQSRRKAQQAERQRFGEVYREIERERRQRTAALQEEQQQRHNTAVAELDAEERRLSAELDGHLQQRRRQTAEAWHALKSAWEAGVSEAMERIDETQRSSRERFPDWERLAGDWSPPESIPDGIRIGDFLVDLSEWQGAVSADMRLAPRTTQWRLPATLPFPNSPSLLLETDGSEARGAALKLLQTAMLRLLTLIPPGKLRFTILDPVGLGESFAGFMHLADADEKIVTSRIWTEPNQIEERLADLTEHMENVLQKYLRNQFATIEEYNEFAGEVAEPYHILVIADFPSKFSEVAGRRLTSIVSSGPRCGVYTLMSLDRRLDLPNAFKKPTLDEQMTRLRWTEDAFHLAEGPLSQWPLIADEPPDPATFTNIVQRVGDASKDARRVEVAFERVAPRDELWQMESLREIVVPMGRAGATKLQEMRLGRGTNQHVLIAGKTGSGKSTLLHVIITNVALHYSPDEVRFYLIDFKKGVEFKDYASLNLPHAEVIAIESDREFGVSALKRLDAELQERGELFRRHGVQDLAGYREANPDQPLPRIMLVIDEFQEFFVEDDKLSQTASLLLDRLVRQGRAFGIHVLLGSQTLGGAYSLARSTLGQVAVRIALQCSESDAHLILSEENTAARLLSRPGEAIYNDANGLLEGNHPFQVAWLPDDEREERLRDIARLAEQRNIDAPPAIVFEGNVPSDPARNARLSRIIRQAGADSETVVHEPRIWLGEAVEIKQPTLVQFRRASGTNLLLVGPDEDAAQGTLATAAVALLSQMRDDAEQPRLYLFDGSALDSPQRRLWERISDIFPGRMKIVEPRNCETAITELSDHQQRRDADRETLHPPLFLLVHHLSRFRDLRKGEEDFGFGSFGGSEEEAKPADPGKQFSEILAGGPDCGIHALVWCDTYNNADRWFSRQTLKEFEYRVAFQMNASDSTNLVDSPAASKLGVHRALLYREETGTSEKFRPYGLPSDWLDRVREQSGNDPDIESATDADLDGIQVL